MASNHSETRSLSNNFWLDRDQPNGEKFPHQRLWNYYFLVFWLHPEPNQVTCQISGSSSKMKTEPWHQKGKPLSMLSTSKSVLCYDFYATFHTTDINTFQSINHIAIILTSDTNSPTWCTKNQLQMFLWAKRCVRWFPWIQNLSLSIQEPLRSVNPRQLWGQC